jgi:hypothetical protein
VKETPSSFRKIPVFILGKEYGTVIASKRKREIMKSLKFLFGAGIIALIFAGACRKDNEAPLGQAETVGTAEGKVGNSPVTPTNTAGTDQSTLIIDPAGGQPQN